MRNPFRYGVVATGEYFGDRVAELAELRADLRNGQNVVMMSRRRYGKSSLVFKARRELQAEGILVAYVDLFRASTKPRLASLLAGAIHEGLVAPVSRVIQDALAIFQKLPLTPRVTINPQDGTPTFEFAVGERSQDVDRTIEALLELPEQIASERGKPVVVILDEFQQVVEIDPQLPGMMRAVFQLQPDIAHAFLGSRRHLLSRVFTQENQPMYRLAKPMALGPIPRVDFAAFIRDRFRSTATRISDDAIEHILDVTACHPHDTQELCYFAWAALEDPSSIVTTGTVESALRHVVEAEDAHYSDLWRKLGTNQQTLLTALAQNGGAVEVFSEEFRRYHRLRGPSSVQRALQSLLDDETVDQDRSGAYHIADVFFQAWIRQTGFR